MNPLLKPNPTGPTKVSEKPASHGRSKTPKHSLIRMKSVVNAAHDLPGQLDKLLDTFRTRETSAVEHFAALTNELYRPSAITIEDYQADNKEIEPRSYTSTQNENGSYTLTIFFSEHKVELVFPPKQYKDFLENHWKNIQLLITITEHEVISETVRKLLSMGFHDINQPLTIIRGYADLLRAELAEEDQLDASVEETIETIQAQTDAILRYSNQMVTVLAANNGKLRMHFDNLEVDDLVANLKKLHRDIYFFDQTDKLTIEADPVHLERAVSNLINNAVKYSPQGSMVIVSLREKDGFFYVDVQDRGSGIDSETEKIFSAYGRGKNIGKKQGYGLGLAYCWLIADRHNGTVDGRNNKCGLGATFSIAIPVNQHETDPRSEDEEVTEE